MRTVRWARRLCFATAAVLAGTSLLAPTLAGAAQNPDEGRPVVWHGVAAATGITQTIDRNGQLSPFYQTEYGAAPDGLSNFGNDIADARASSYYPGAFATLLGTICGQGLNQLPGPPCNPTTVPFPTVAHADAVSPDAQATTSQTLGGNGAPVTVTITGAKAHAGRDFVATDASIGAFDASSPAGSSAATLAFRKQSAAILGGPLAAAAVKPQASDGSAAHVGGGEAHTKQVYDGLTLVVHAETTLKGIDFMGGTIHIDQIFSTSTSKSDGHQVLAHDEKIVLSGVSVQGQPASIDQNGISINGAGQGKPALDQLNGALQQALAAQGSEIKLLSTTTSTEGTTITSEAQGLLVHMQGDLRQLPAQADVYYVILTLGTAGTSAFASPDRNVAAPLEEGGIGGVDTGTPAIPGTPAVDIPGTPGQSLSTPASFTPGTRAQALPSRTARSAGFLGELERELRGALISHRFDILYLAFTLAFIGLCLSSRLLVPRARRA